MAYREEEKVQQASQEIHDATYPTLKDGLYLHLMPEDSMLYLDDKQFVGVTINRTADEISTCAISPRR